MTTSYVDKRSTLECACGCGFKPKESAVWFLESLAREYNAKFQKELYVTSGARCFNHNSEVGGKPNSAHTRGLAFDVAFFSSRECYVIMAHLFKMGVRRIGVNFAKSFIHFDIDTDLPQDVLFKY